MAGKDAPLFRASRGRTKRLRGRSRASRSQAGVEIIEYALRILIVDDGPNIRRTLRVALEASGHDVEEATSGSKALALVGRHPHDVTLLDLRLGGESGLDLLGPLRD